MDKKIIKVQRDMSGEKVLAYNEDQSIYTEMPYEKKLKIGVLEKKYFKGGMEKGYLVLGDEVEEQAW